MNRSAKLSLKFANPGKLVNLKEFIHEYSRVCKILIDELWSLEKVPMMLGKDQTSHIKTWLSARAMQAAAKQSSGIVRGTRAKNERRNFVLKKLIAESADPEKIERLRKAIARNKEAKPFIGFVNPELDSRFFKLEKSHNSFDLWLKLGSLGRKLSFNIPLKKTGVFNKWSVGKIAGSVRLCMSSVSLSFDVTAPIQKSDGNVVGLDVGLKTALTLSDGQVSSEDCHGHTLETIIQKISRKKKGSKGFKRATNHRKNHIGWAINRLNFSGLREIRAEKLNFRGCKKSRLLSHWTYGPLFDKLERKCEEEGVLLTRVSSAYTSQKCSSCGDVDKGNRKGKVYKCSCGTIMDADLNASLNLRESIVPANVFP